MSWHRKLPNQAACSSCCGIKEKLQTLWDRTINSILRINQVEPDDQGNIRIVSADDAVVITEGTNEIQIGLDQSELPAGAVQSVNGQTGAVVLDANDIDAGLTPPGTTIAQDLASTKQQMQTIGGLLQQEVTDRQNADTALQNNINTLQASIPTEAAAAVAADPTVQTFAAAAADIPNKVDKRTSAGLRAYTHTGSTQDDTVIEDSTNGATIPIRDANGRLHAADPAAGATDKTLTTANWVSQTGDGGPNNLVHKSGNETISGTKTFNSYPRGIGPVATSINDQQTPNHVLICKFQGLYNGSNMRIIVDTIHGHYVITVSYYNSYTLNAYYMGIGNHAYSNVHIYQKDGDYYLIIDNSVWNTSFRAYTEITGSFGTTQNYNFIDYSVMTLLPNMDDYTLVVTAGNGGTIR